MSEYEVGRVAEGFLEPVTAGEQPRESADEMVDEPVDESVDEPAGEPADELVEEYAEPYAESYADPQEWIGSLIAKLERAEQGIGSGPRDVLMARIKLAQAYSELGDTVQAAPLAVANVAQARRLFPSSEGMLRQLREFRDAACEAAGWTAAMMREEADAEADQDGADVGSEEPSELVTRPEAEPAAAAPPAPAAAPAPAPAPESAGAVIHEFVRRPQDPDTTQWAAENPTALPQPAEVAIPTPPEPEYAEEVEPALASADLADLSDLADLAAIEEIIRLRYELRESQRTIERLRHVNRKLREALEFDEAP